MTALDREPQVQWMLNPPVLWGLLGLVLVEGEKNMKQLTRSLDIRIHSPPVVCIPDMVFHLDMNSSFLRFLVGGKVAFYAYLDLCID